MKTDTQKGVGRGKIERGRGKITGRKEGKKKIQLHLWDLNPQPHDVIFRYCGVSGMWLIR